MFSDLEDNGDSKPDNNYASNKAKMNEEEPLFVNSRRVITNKYNSFI